MAVGLAVLGTAATVAVMRAQDPAPATQDASIAPDAGKKGGRGGGGKGPPRTGVSTPGVRREMAALTPIATFPVEGNPDWQVTTGDAEWVTSGRKNIVARMDPKTNMVTAEVTVAADPAGVTYGEGYVWVTSPKSNMLTGIDPKTAKVVYSV